MSKMTWRDRLIDRQAELAGHHVDGANGRIGRVRRRACVGPQFQDQVTLACAQAHIACGNDVAFFGCQPVEDAAVGGLQVDTAPDFLQRDVAVGE